MISVSFDADNLIMFCDARESVLTNGPSAGCREIDLRVPRGVDLRIFPDRGFDIGQAWWNGRPLAWVDHYRENHPFPMLRGNDWIRSFSGGLLTTCGLRHIGQPVNGHGLHGTFSHQRAQVKAVGVSFDDAGPYVSARGIVVEPGSFGSLLEIDRVIVSRADTGQVVVTDVVGNSGMTAESLELLYHLNFRYSPHLPLSVSVNGEEIKMSRFEEADDTIEIPFRREDSLLIDLLDPVLRVSATIEIRNETFSHLYLWRHVTSPSQGVVSIEPATTALFGKDRARAERILLEPKERLHAGLTVSVRDLDN